MSKPEQFLSQRQRYQPIVLPQTFTDEEMIRDWNLPVADHEVIGKYHKKFRLHMAIQLCAVRLYGRFLKQVHDLAPQIVDYLGQQLELPPSLGVEVPAREATYLEHRQVILQHLGFQRFGDRAQQQLEAWLTMQAQMGLLPDDLFHQSGLCIELEKFWSLRL
ncbi:MAG: DUF4158 domain-containing protein [Cyanobacteria bacterium P01_D01_bin.6]